MASRTLVSLGDERIAKLDSIAKARGVSRSAIVREAVDRVIDDSISDDDDRTQRDAAIHTTFGAWKHRTDIGDAVEWQRRERAGWTRPWDHDYDEVRAEFPDLFSAEEDHERAIWKARQGKNQGEPDA